MDRAQELQAMPFGERRMYARSLGIDVSRKQPKDLIVEIIQEEELRKSKKTTVVDVVLDSGDLPNSNDALTCSVSDPTVRFESDDKMLAKMTILEEQYKELEGELAAFDKKVEQILVSAFNKVADVEKKNIDLETRLSATMSNVSSLEEEMNGAFLHIEKIYVEIGWSSPFPKEKKCLDDVEVTEDKQANKVLTDGVESKYPSIKVIQEMRLADLKGLAKNIAEDLQENIPVSTQTKKQLLEYVIFGLSKLQGGE